MRDPQHHHARHRQGRLLGQESQQERDHRAGQRQGALPRPRRHEPHVRQQQGEQRQQRGLQIYLPARPRHRLHVQWMPREEQSGKKGRQPIPRQSAAQRPYQHRIEPVEEQVDRVKAQRRIPPCVSFQPPSRMVQPSIHAVCWVKCKGRPEAAPCNVVGDPIVVGQKAKREGGKIGEERRSEHEPPRPTVIPGRCLFVDFDRRLRRQQRPPQAGREQHAGEGREARIAGTHQHHDGDRGRDRDDQRGRKPTAVAPHHFPRDRLRARACGAALPLGLHRHAASPREEDSTSPVLRPKEG